MADELQEYVRPYDPEMAKAYGYKIVGVANHSAGPGSIVRVSSRGIQGMVLDDAY